MSQKTINRKKKKLAQELFGGKKNKSQDIAKVLLSIARKIIDYKVRNRITAKNLTVSILVMKTKSIAFHIAL